VQRLNLNSTTYNLNSGTSMATPLVAGVSAMLFNLNPNYSYKDVIEAINTSGKALTALSGKTVTGKMVNAQGSIDYIAKPTGVSASVAP
jgi:serine protease